MKTSSEIKTMARQKMAPNMTALVLSVVIYGAILIGLSFVIAFIYTTNLISQGVFETEEAMMQFAMGQMENDPLTSNPLILYGFEILIGALLTTLSTGLSYVCLKAARNEEVKASDMFKVYSMNPDKIIIIYIVGFAVKFLAEAPAMLIGKLYPATEALSIGTALAFLFEVIGIVLQIAVTVLLSQAYFIYIDDIQQNSLVSIRQSVLLMKKHFFRYLLLMIGFIPWIFVILFTFGIASIVVIPYMYTSYAIFYMDIKGEFNERKNTSVYMDITV